MMTKIFHLFCALLGLLAVSACGGAGSSGAAASSGSACEPRVGVYATDLAGNSPSAEINAIIANMVSELQQLGDSTGVVVVNKVSGFEEAGSVHYLVFINTEAYTYRLVDGETGEILAADFADAAEWSVNVDQVASWLQSTVKTAIDQHDLVTLGAGPAVSVAAGSSVTLDYSVSTAQGRIVARSTIGTLGGSAQADGSSTFRVSGAKVEDYTLAVPLDAASGSYTVSVQSTCRYDPTIVIATLEPVTVTVQQSALVGLWCARSQDDPVFDSDPPRTYLGDCSDTADYLRIYESGSGLQATPLIGLCEDEVPTEDLLTLAGDAVSFTTRSTGGLNFPGCDGDSFAYALTRNGDELLGQYIGHYDNPGQSDQQIDVIYIKASDDPCALTSWNDGTTQVVCQ